MAGKTCNYCGEKRLTDKFIYDADLKEICWWCYLKHLKENHQDKPEVIRYFEHELGIEHDKQLELF